MKSIALFSLAAVTLFASASGASAQYYYNGPGYGAHIEPRFEREYEERDYYRPRRDYYQRRGDYYQRQDDYRARGAIIGENSYGRRELYYQVAPGGRCPPRYSVQDGLCKPYRGY
jgi:hypothetical protein